MRKITKTIITAAGMGTRLLPYTKETPKEMMPIYSTTKDGQVILKPILQVIFESIYDFGVRDFCFVVGRGKRSIEDHFLTSDKNNNLVKRTELRDFFGKIQKSNMLYVQQASAKGFGDAVLKGRSFAQNDNFLLHAGDDVILSKENNHLKRLVKAFFDHDADIAFLVTRIKDPRNYGVIEGIKEKDGVIIVKNLEEKPDEPKSHLAVIATYIFKPMIFTEIMKIKPDEKGEIQLANAIQSVIKTGNAVAVELRKDEKRIDVGTPDSYIDCLKDSYAYSKHRSTTKRRRKNNGKK
ncbi:MAG: sugar phosphate nucleotidyltransferase [Nitrosopumilaceae archaeon]|jgi:UTP--glucose-1-phosphate uridylyltransferase